MLIGSDAFLPDKYARKKERVTKSAEKKDATIPIESVTAKPWTCLLYTSPSPRD